MDDVLDKHLSFMLQAMTRGNLVPFLGAGASLCGRPKDLSWPNQDKRYLPSGSELAKFLADEHDYPGEDTYDLLRVAQYVEHVGGPGALYEELHEVFAGQFAPTVVHRFFARLPQRLKEKGYPDLYPLIITTNYDDLMEQAFRTEAPDLDFDVVSYKAVAPYEGQFLHQLPNGEVHPIELPNEYVDLPIQENRLERPIILKVHGAISPTDPSGDSFVITEDDYIHYLTRTDLSKVVPKAIVALLRKSSLLFLGYSLRDWNLRAILHQIWKDEPLWRKSWAIQTNPDELEKLFWSDRKVAIIDYPLEEYIAALEKHTASIKPRAT